MRKLKISTSIAYAVAIIWVLFALVDMWFNVVSFSVFIKITISVFVLLLFLFIYNLGGRASSKE